MKGQPLEILLRNIKEIVMDKELNNSELDKIVLALKDRLEQEFEKIFNKQEEKYKRKWNIVLGKKFSVSTTVDQKWFAHVYLKEGISGLFWTTF